MIKLKAMKTLAALGIALTVSGAAMAAGLYTNGVPPAGGTQYPSTIPLTGIETFPADTNLTNGQNPASEAVSSAQLSAYVNGQARPNNALIGGDSTTNLWQRNTTGSPVASTVTYGGPDRWFYWTAAATTIMQVSRSTTAAALPSGFKSAFYMQKQNASAGTDQVCMAQEVESVNSYQFQGSNAELDFHAYPEANFSGAGVNMTAYIVYGTGTDEGSAKMAWGLNGGGTAGAGWTGQTSVAAAVVPLGAVSTLGRYVVVSPVIPTTATEIGVALCYTPVGTALANDGIKFSGIQLVRNANLAAYASATVGYASTAVQATSFDRRPQGLETVLQQRYFWQYNEATTQTVAVGTAKTTGTAWFVIPSPVTMRTAPPTVGTTVGSYQALNSTGTLATLTALATVGANTNSVSAVVVVGTLTAAFSTTPLTATEMQGNSGTGAISANAEL